ncbi:MAG TPA: hypothetical protein PL182_07575 [Pseudobdellovibrionaceae bacterium]|nr:hypothetical protein [Pseudobdellovibrionaceae bacterium]
MRAFSVLAFVCFSLSVHSAEAGQLCLSDGTCLEDPSLTTETKPKTDLPSGLNLDSTGTWSMIQAKCSKDNYNKGIVKYASPEACLQENMAELNKRAQANYDKAKKSGGSNSQDGGGNSPGGGQQGGQGGQQGDQANNQQGGGQQQQGDQQQGQQGDQGQGAQAAQHDPVKAEEPLNMPNASCSQAVTAHLQRCEKTRKAADLKCDPSKDKGIQSSERSSKDSGMLAKASDRANRNAAMSAVDQHGLSESVSAFAGSCRLGHRQCERECMTVRKAFEKYCANASPSDKAKAQAAVAKAEGKENGLYCSKDLAQKADQADQQAAVSSQNAEQHAGVNDQTSGSGGGGGGEGLSGLLGQMAQLNQQKQAEKEALKKALEAATAQEGLEQACQRSQFQDLEECVCRGLSASSCAAKMPTRLPSNFDPNYLLSTPAE